MTIERPPNLRDRIDALVREHLDMDKARQVREWRAYASWRKVAELAAEAGWDWVASGHQLYGEALCFQSAQMLGEDPHEEPWN